jgi:hypothetical protein
MRPGAQVRASVVASVLSFATLAGAAEPAFSLEWHAPLGCPSRDSLVARVNELLGEREETVTRVPLAAREYVTLLPDGRFRAELDIVQAGGERSRALEAATCSEIAEASAVVLVLAISPEPDTAAAVPMPPLEKAPAAKVESARVEEPREKSDRGVTSPAARQGSTHVRVLAALGAALDFALAEAAAPGVALSATAGYRHVTFAVRGSFFPARSSSVPEQPSQGVEISLLAFAPLACIEPFTLPVELAACAEFELGYLHASGYGPPEHYERSSSWLAPGVGLSAAYPRQGRIRSRFGFELLVPLTHTEFVLTNVGVAHTLPAVDPRLGLALEVAFP